MKKMSAKKYFLLGIVSAFGVLLLIVLVGAAVFFPQLFKFSKSTTNQTGQTGTVSADDAQLTEMVIPNNGVTLPANWGDLGKRLVQAGVIDQNKLLSIYQQRGTLDLYENNLLKKDGNGALKMTPQNSGFILNMLWALGLSNKNVILDGGPMQGSGKGSVGRFASTGGWVMAKGNAMDYYSKFPFIILTKEQQNVVEQVSQNIYRPCCNNSTYFPDCNHGMAMLGLLELMASQGVNEDNMYKAALQVNAYWFPSTYLTIAKYYQEKRGISWSSVDPREVLSAKYSSATGSQTIQNQVTPVQTSGGGGCGI